MKHPRVSICIPAYRAEKYLTEALASVKAQTFDDWEVIVTEDGSRDATESIVADFRQNVPNAVVYNRHQVNRGLPETRNTGISASAGAWVAFLDADDLWSPDHLTSLTATAETTKADMIFGNSVWFETSIDRPLKIAAPGEHHLKNLPAAIFSGEVGVQPSAVMVRRDIIKKIGGFSSDHPVCNDLEYWLRVLRNGYAVRPTGMATCYYRRHPENMTAAERNLKSTIDLAEVCAKYHDWSGLPFPLRRTHPATLFQWASRMALESNPRLALSLILRSLKINPFSPRAWKSLYLAARARR